MQLVSYLAFLISIFMMKACQTRQSYDFLIELDGKKIPVSMLPYAFQQARFELEYAKRVSEKTLVNQYLGDVYLLANRDDPKLTISEVEKLLFPVSTPTEDELIAFHEQMRKLLPQDYKANRAIIEDVFVRLKSSQLKKQHLKNEVDKGRISVFEPKLIPPRYDFLLPDLPGSESNQKNPISILIVSVRDCEICLQREEYLQNTLKEYKDRLPYKLQVIDTYPGDTSSASYQLHRRLLCSAKTPQYWEVRQLVFLHPDPHQISKKIDESIGIPVRKIYENCLTSNEPELINYRNNRLAQELYSKQLYSIYINKEKIAFPTEQILKAKFEEIYNSYGKLR